MKQYFTTAELYNAADEIVTKKVKAYRSDWTEYDAPKFLDLAQSLSGAAVLIAREHGTYLLKVSDLKTNESTIGILHYYLDENTNHHINRNSFYLVDFRHRTITRKQPETLKREFPEFKYC